MAKGINFLQSFLNIKDKIILKQLEDIPLFDTDSNFVRVNNVIVISYIAQKLRAEYLWQRFPNFIIPKYFFECIFYQYKENCTHELFRLCTRAYGNLVLKRLWIHFIQWKVYFL